MAWTKKGHSLISGIVEQCVLISAVIFFATTRDFHNTVFAIYLGTTNE